MGSGEPCRSIRTALGDLTGEPLNAVSFVMDYVELHFNGPVVRCLTDPTVSTDGRTATFPGPGSRDALCMLIDRTLMLVDCGGGEVVLRFERGAAVTIPLDAGSNPTGESLHFVTGVNRPLLTW